MLVVGATFVLATRLGRSAGFIPRWIAATAWIVAIALILGMSIALLFPFGAWLIAFGLTWKEGGEVARPDDSSRDPVESQRRRVE